MPFASPADTTMNTYLNTEHDQFSAEDGNCGGNALTWFPVDSGAVSKVEILREWILVGAEVEWLRDPVRTHPLCQRRSSISQARLVYFSSLASPSSLLANRLQSTRRIYRVECSRRIV